MQLAHDEIRLNRSPGERSDTREKKIPHIAGLIRATMIAFD
jgi:hypothetical protein